MRLPSIFSTAYLGSEWSTQKVVMWLGFGVIWKKRMKGIQKLPSTYKWNFIKYLNRPHFSLNILSNFSDHQIIMLFLLLPFFFSTIWWTNTCHFCILSISTNFFFGTHSIEHFATCTLLFFLSSSSFSSYSSSLIENDKIKERKYKFHT